MTKKEPIIEEKKPIPIPADREYNIIKKNGKYYEQTEKEVDVDGMKAKLEDLKNRKRIAVEQVSKIYDSRIEALETSLNNIK